MYASPDAAAAPESSDIVDCRDETVRSLQVSALYLGSQGRGAGQRGAEEGCIGGWRIVVVREPADQY